MDDASMASAIRFLLLALVLTVHASAAALAQNYPARPIRVIVPHGPGGLSDLFMRQMGEGLSKRLGQPIVVENKVGANGSIAARQCAEAEPDGYTICILSADMLAYNHLILPGNNYDSGAKLVPITNLFALTQVLAVGSSLDVKDLGGLAAYAKAKPGTLSYSCPALAMTLFVENFKKDTGSDIVRVPFKSGSDAVTGMLNGSTPLSVLGIGNIISHLQAGTIRGLVVDTDERSPLFPDIPTVREIGYKGDITLAAFGLVAPAGTPQAVIDLLHKESVAVAGEPSFRKSQMIDRGFAPILNTPAQFAATLKQDRATAERIVDAAGVRAK
jgi:tripartite-type tricarboxylate transporter receptor subunit TctC